MNSETKTCQNCKQNFTVDAEDFEFYKKIVVPPPTFCPECRFQRRAAYRNERKLFWNKSAKTGKPILSLFSPKTGFPIYEEKEWWTDDWDAMSFGRDYDFSKTFFAQVHELQNAVPRFSRSVINMENSDYCANAGYLKNCYLAFNSNFDEDCAYGNAIDHSRDCFDNSHVDKCERCYGSMWVQNSYQTHFSVQCEGCNSVWFSKNCRGCSDCFGCVNLSNKKFHIFNVGYDEQTYRSKLLEMKLHSWTGLQIARTRAYEFWKKFPNKYVQGTRNEDSTGEYVTHSKNVKQSYLVREGENLKYVQYLQVPPNKDCYDHTVWGQGNQLTYENTVCGLGAYNVKFSAECWTDIQNLEYCAYCSSSSELFGCVGLRKKKFCILNKQYSESEYRTLREKIVAQMNAAPYVDKGGRVYKYGEFFPTELSPHAYNYTIAQDHLPLTKEDAGRQGYRFEEPEAKEYQTTACADELPDSIHETTETILKEIIQCTNCKKAYKIIKPELTFLHKEGIPLPRTCVDCRQEARIALRNKSKLYHRQCMCDSSAHGHAGRCPINFETSYSPDGQDIVYCEQCYQAEVV